MAAREAWGLDIGQTALHAVKLRRTKDGAEIADAYFRKLGTVIDDPKYDEKVASALAEFVQEKKVGTTPVVASLPGFTTLFREFPIPVSGSVRIEEIVTYEAKQLIPYPLEEVVWGFHQLRRDDDSGEVQVALVCCRRDIVGGLLAMLDNAGLNVEGLNVSPLALVNYIIYDQSPEETVLLLDTGARSTDFVVLDGESFWLRSIGVSGGDLSKALMGKFNISFEEAESLKGDMGDSKQADRIFRVVTPVLRNLCSEVQRSLGYYRSIFRGAKVGEIVCAGNTFLLPGIDQFVADNAGLPCRALDVPESLPAGATVDEEELSTNRQVLGTATGLALQGIGLGHVEINLLPRERRLKKLLAAKFKFAVAGLVVLIGAVALNLAFSGSRAGIFGDLTSQVAQLKQQADKAAAEYATIEKEFKPEEERNRALANVAPSRGFLIEASGKVLDVVERLNRSRGGVSEAEFKTAFERERMQRLSEWPDLRQDKDLLAKIDEQLKYRLQWRFRRARRIFAENMDYQVVDGKFKKGKDAAAPLEFVLPEELGGQSAAVENMSRSSLSRTRPGSTTAAAEEFVTQPVVQVTFAGFLVGDSARDALELKDELGKIPGVLTKPVIFKHTTNEQNDIMLPKVKKPTRTRIGETRGAAVPVPGNFDLGGGEGAAGDDANKVEFETDRERVIRFTAILIYQPQGN